VSRWFALIGLAIAGLVSGGCPETPSEGTPAGPSVTRHWDFDLGNRGGGTLHFNASGPSGPESGDCVLAVCHTRIEDGTRLELTAIAASGSRFKVWEGDPANGLACGAASSTNQTVSVTVARTGGCFAVFEPVGPGGPTAPGVDDTVTRVRRSRDERANAELRVLRPRPSCGMVAA